MSHMRTESWRIHTDTDTFTIIDVHSRVTLHPIQLARGIPTPICESNVTIPTPAFCAARAAHTVV